jgi:hypothetical protein
LNGQGMSPVEGWKLSGLCICTFFDPSDESFRLQVLDPGVKDSLFVCSLRRSSISNLFPSGAYLASGMLTMIVVCALESYSLAHLAVPHGGQQDPRLEPKYIAVTMIVVARAGHKVVAAVTANA